MLGCIGIRLMNLSLDLCVHFLVKSNFSNIPAKVSLTRNTLNPQYLITLEI